MAQTEKYEVTATRRRPKTFDELEGQEFVSATLKSSIENGKMAHAYLFSGPRGCGKTSAARILARALNCEKGEGSNPCGVCPSCLEIAKGASLDVIEIDGASNTGVNDVRQIKEEVLYPPARSRYKVYIIDEVHMLSTSAFNALLKTIEEPPSYIIFIFATTELHKVPPTIKSRCQQFQFRLIPIDTIVTILRSACVEVGLEAEDEALFWIARESTGSLRDAYTLFDQVASFSGGSLKAATIREKLGIAGLERLNALVDKCVDGNLKDALEAVNETLERGVAIEQLIIDLSGYFRSVLLLNAGITREALIGEKGEHFSSKAQALSVERLLHALDLLLALYRDVRYSLSPRFELETVIANLCMLHEWVSPSELREAVTKTKNALVGVSAPVAVGGAPIAAGNAPSGAAYGMGEGTRAGAYNGSAAERGFQGGGAQGGAAQMGLKESFRRTLMENKNTATRPTEPRDPVQVVQEVFNGTIVN